MSKYPGNGGQPLAILREIRVKGKKTGKYPMIIPLKTNDEILLAKGLKEFSIDGRKIIALNKKNAHRKLANKIEKEIYFKQ